MSTISRRNLATFLLVLGAVVFGMVLAGGLQLTAPSIADQETSRLSATRVASEHANNLPSFADLAEAVEPGVIPDAVDGVPLRAEVVGRIRRR